ncbi:hypothetical protein FKR81_21175 [Lentzea tibetensis]|uniref:Uncharacterized protein n=1 Tax=Lentzea tibetensis TaxID=2591470 RepID=A0A563ER43_9PSEU|nr:hypothetical protein [Lentzea tibetensis]TWP50225.1 hypothetical protein FKR81_21175 [Lentzea tibetensis]
MMEPRRRADEIINFVGDNLRGHPLADQVRNKIEAWNDPRRKLDRKRERASSALTVWAILITIFGTLAVFGFTGVLGTAVGVMGTLGAGVMGVLAIRTGQKMRQLTAARQRLELTMPPKRPPLPPHISAARMPMEQLHSAEDTLAELLRQLDSSALTSMPTSSIQHARATSAEASAAIRALSAQLQGVERARNTAPPLQRAPLVESVRVLRARLADGVDGYCALVAAAGNALAASTAQNPRSVLDDATDHLAGLASAMRDVSGYSAF